MRGTKVSGEDETVAMPADASSELPTMGELLGGRYELLGLLGVGGMGSVYRARDVELDEIVALKMIGRELVSSPVILERFRQEVKLARRVTHRNVARMFDIGEHQKLKFLTMECIDGESLGDVLERETVLSTARVVEICTAICAGLAAAHDAGVVHRDLKPDNVMLAKDGRVLITDFGIARAIDGGAKRTAGMPVGTPAYMAPEQVEGASDIDARADIYALGAMMYEMTVGAAPFEGDSMFAVAAARLIHPPPDPQARKKDVPDGLAKIIVKCMQRRREDRYASALDVAHAFDAITLPAFPSQKQAVSAHADAVSLVPSPISESEDGRKLVAVLPFKNSGQPDDAHIAEGLTEDLLDALSMVAGIRVRARSSVHADASAARDTGELGRLLNVHVVVDGSIRRMGERLRVTIRLVSVADGLQLWAKRFDATVGEVFRIGDEAASAIAQALTVERDRPLEATTTDPIAVDLFLRARHEYHLIWHDAAGRAVSLFADAIKRAPNDARILGGYALALARRYAYDFDATSSGPEAIAIARRTLALQPHSSAARTAIAVVHWNDNDLEGAATEIAIALRHGPANGDAHDFYGRLLLECGHVEEAVERLKMALAVEGRLAQAKYEMIRALALLGKWDEAWRRLGNPPADGSLLNAYWTARMRLHGWQRDEAGALACESLIAATPFETQSMLLAFMEVISGRTTPDAMTAVLGQFADANAVARRSAFFRQLVVEIWSSRGESEKALAALEASARGRLSDLAWLDLCPVLEPIRNHLRFKAVRDEVAVRTSAALAILRSA
jgi:serine/threonine-protein kinase